MALKPHAGITPSCVNASVSPRDLVALRGGMPQGHSDVLTGVTTPNLHPSTLAACKAYTAPRIGMHYAHGEGPDCPVKACRHCGACLPTCSRMYGAIAVCIEVRWCACRRNCAHGDTAVRIKAHPCTWTRCRAHEGDTVRVEVRPCARGRGRLHGGTAVRMVARPCACILNHACLCAYAQKPAADFTCSGRLQTADGMSRRAAPIPQQRRPGRAVPMPVCPAAGTGAVGDDSAASGDEHDVEGIKVSVWGREGGGEREGERGEQHVRGS
eukprot:355908-Chlamydomonas_euryale.AAC.6